MSDSRQIVVDWAKYFAGKVHNFTYSQGSDRMDAVGKWPMHFPIAADCSSFVTFLWWLAGAPDPNGLNYNHTGYTGTLLSHCTHIPANKVVPGDLVVYGPGSGQHVAVIVAVSGSDILTVSHGGPTGFSPIYCWVNAPKKNPHKYPVDGRTPQRFLRAEVKTIRAPKPVPVS